eukprot:3899329-Pyramimonas_sp.AAC.1
MNSALPGPRACLEALHNWPCRTKKVGHESLPARRGERPCTVEVSRPRTSGRKSNINAACPALYHPALSLNCAISTCPFPGAAPSCAASSSPTALRNTSRAAAFPCAAAFHWASHWSVHART